MNAKEIKQAQKMLKTLERSRMLIQACDDNCVILKEVKSEAIESNMRCQNILKNRLRIEENWTRADLLY
jgi:hypothetical protein